MRGFLGDCRHALRLYRKTPGSSLIAVGVLAVAMAFVVAFLSLYTDLVLRPYPGFERGGRISTVGQNADDLLLPFSYAATQRLADEMSSIDAIAFWGHQTVLAGIDREATSTALVSAAFFSGLRPQLQLGRGLEARDHAVDAEPVAVLSYRYWQRHFGGRRDIVGNFLELARDPEDPYYNGLPGEGPAEPPERDSAQFRIVGVTAPSLRGLPTPATPIEPALWLPVETAWPLFGGVTGSVSYGYPIGTYVRRARGASSEAVANELRARYEGPDSTFATYPGARLDALDGIVGNIAVQRSARRQLELFLAGSILLALVAAANVSLFLLARAPGRRRELGTRMALGAPVRRLARQLATEAGLIVISGALLALLGSLWLSSYLRGLPLLREAQWQHVSLLDWRVLSLAGAFVIALGLLVSLAPILGLKRLGIAASSRQATARASLAQRLAGTAQIAVAGSLGGAAIAFAWYLGLLMFGDAGYSIEDRYFVESQARGLSSSSEARIVEISRWRAAVEAIPGVTAVAFGSPVPGEPRRPLMTVSSAVDPALDIEVYRGFMDHRLIDVLGLTLLHGPMPDGTETNSTVVNQAAARAIWGRDDVVGERLPGLEMASWGPVVGVLADLSYEHPSAPVSPYAFGLGLSSLSYRTAIIETSLSAAQLEQALTELEISGALEMEVLNVRSLRDMRNELIAADRARSFLTIATAVLVVLLAAFGFYGTQRYLVAAGRREYAIRASLGAGPSALARLVLWRGLLLGLPGMLFGALLAFITVLWLRDDFLSSEISSALVTAWIIAALLLLLLAASLPSARKAKTTHPAPLLRED